MRSSRCSGLAITKWFSHARRRHLSGTVDLVDPDALNEAHPACRTVLTWTRGFLLLRYATGDVS